MFESLRKKKYAKSKCARTRLLSLLDTKADGQAILVFAYLGQRLLDSVSFINRFDINEEQLAQLTLATQEYLRVNAMFLSTSVNPTVWTLGHVVPVHAQQVFAQYNKGLALVSMEG